MKAPPLVHGRGRLHGDLVLEVCDVQREHRDRCNIVTASSEELQSEYISMLDLCTY